MNEDKLKGKEREIGGAGEVFQPDSVVTERVEGEGKEKREGVKRRMTEAWGKQFPELCIDFIKASS